MVQVCYNKGDVSLVEIYFEEYVEYLWVIIDIILGIVIQFEYDNWLEYYQGYFDNRCCQQGDK